MTPSPCVGLCRIDPAVELCGGCARSTAEIMAWKDADAADRARIWADLPRRRTRLGIRLHRLGWMPDEILDFVGETLRADRGAWSVGTDGASARFVLGGDDPCTIDRDGAMITAATASAAIRFTITERVRVLALTPEQASAAPARELLLLAVPRSRTSPRPHARLTPLGADHDAIRPSDREAQLYDLGLDSAVAGFCLRTADRALAAELDRRSGQDWVSLLADLGDRLARDLACPVIGNPVARVEVFGPTDPPFDQSPALLDLVRLVRGRETPSGIDIPESFLPCAIFDLGIRPERAPGQRPPALNRS